MISLRLERQRGPLRLASMAGLALLFSSPPLAGAGLSTVGQGTKAIALGGAFVAQADDPSTLFYNVGGLAFVRATELSNGVVLQRSDNIAFASSEAVPAEEGASRQSPTAFFPPMVYLNSPVGDDMALGIGFYVPYQVASEWRNRDHFSGRFLGERFSVSVLDLSLGAGWRLTPRFGLGLAAVGRLSRAGFGRRVAPASPDAGERRLLTDEKYASGLGWSLGILHKPSDRLSWGASYRSAIEIRQEGRASLSDAPSFFPYVLHLEYPPELRLGVAFVVRPLLRMELAVDHVDWTSFDRVDFAVDSDAALSTPLFSGWEAAHAYRLGLRFGRRVGGEWCLGYAWEESPQPASDVGPVLVDSDTQTFTVGYSSNRERFAGQFAVGYRLPEDRRARDHRGGLDGNYRKEGSWFVAVTQHL